MTARWPALVLAGSLMMVASLAHAFLGWAAMRAGLEEAGAPADLAGALGAGWHWGSVTMAATGLVVALCGWRLRRGDGSGITVAGILAAAYLLFGLAAFLARGLNPHFLLFVALGCLAGVPLIGARRALGGGTPRR